MNCATRKPSIFVGDYPIDNPERLKIWRAKVKRLAAARKSLPIAVGGGGAPIKEKANV